KENQDDLSIPTPSLWHFGDPASVHWICHFGNRCGRLFHSQQGKCLAKTVCIETASDSGKTFPRLQRRGNEAGNDASIHHFRWISLSGSSDRPGNAPPFHHRDKATSRWVPGSGFHPAQCHGWA